MAKKVLGVSFGPKRSNCDIMVKHTLMQCEKAGCEVQFIRADDLDVSNCTGCIACVIGMITGQGKVNFTLEERERSRLRWGGKLEHSTEIKTQAQPSGTIKNLKELKAPCAGYAEAPFSRD